MVYTRPNSDQDTSKTVWLQSLGETLGVLAGNLQVGDHMVWNFGSTTEVLEITPKGQQSIVVRGQYLDYSKRLVECERVLRKNRVVAVLFDGKPITTTRTKENMNYSGSYRLSNGTLVPSDLKYR